MNIEENYTWRVFPLDSSATSAYRSEYRRDYARVLHSPSFRRLAGKTQLFPGDESDFFRDRLTHSLEVAQIAKSIALKLQYENPTLSIEPDVCEIAGLMHDLGHPPFGHNGERALDKCMACCGGFEGNAQTLRIITKLEKKETQYSQLVRDCDKRVGLNLTARVIASALKYDKEIPHYRDSSDLNFSLFKGYYHTERDLVSAVKCQIVGEAIPNFKTVECSIMDIADDISYSTYDLEDAFKAGFLTPYDMMMASDVIYIGVIERLRKDKILDESTNMTDSIKRCKLELKAIFYETWRKPVEEQKKLKAYKRRIGTSTKVYNVTFDESTVENFLTSYKYSLDTARDGYERTQFTSFLVNAFIEGVRVEINHTHPVLSKVYLTEQELLRVNILKHFASVALINSSRLKVAESRGTEIVERLFRKLSDNGDRLLPEDYRVLYNNYSDDGNRKRMICDFIAGMTDRYAIEFYCRLFSENARTIFRPL